MTTGGNGSSFAVPSKSAAKLCRVFLSYARRDRELADRIVGHLEQLDVVVFRDSLIEAGEPYPDAITSSINRSHLFIPLLTPASIDSPWVHQEIGYALGVHVPVLPLAVDVEPGQMLQHLQAVTLTPERLQTELTRPMIERLVRKPPGDDGATFERASFDDRRTKLLIEYSTAAFDLQQSGASRIRQSGGLTSFSIPSVSTGHRHWKERDGKPEQGEARRRQLLDERCIQEKHARAAGCSLIIDPTFPLANGSRAKRRRLLTLIEFLKSMPAAALLVVVRREPPPDPGTTVLVGDWFMASSVSPRPFSGYRETLFTWHAPTVRRHVEEFDEEIDRLLGEQRIKPEESGAVAIDELLSIVRPPRAGTKAPRRKPTARVRPRTPPRRR